MMSDYSVETINDGLNEFNVEFNGPKDSNVFILLIDASMFCARTERIRSPTLLPYPCAHC